MTTVKFKLITHLFYPAHNNRQQLSDWPVIPPPLKLLLLLYYYYNYYYSTTITVTTIIIINNSISYILRTDCSVQNRERRLPSRIVPPRWPGWCSGISITCAW